MRWARAVDVLWRSAPGYLVLGHSDGSTIEIAGPGGEIWNRLEVPVDEEQLVARLAELYAADHSTIRRDATELLQKLHTAGYVDRLH